MSEFFVIPAKKRKMDQQAIPSNPPDEGGGRAARDYQLDLLEKAKEMNAIVYLGTGSGKTYIAIMLIKHMRAELGSWKDGRFLNGKKVILLSPSVALVDQQAKEIENCTGLSVGRYTGADGVDDWDQTKWREEIDKHQVLCLVHDVFILARQCSAIFLKEICLMILDECHHVGAGSHSYAVIMDQYRRDKEIGNPVPKILGLTACIVVKKCNVIKFREEKQKLERKMDAQVITTEEQNLFNLLKYVTAPNEFTISYSQDLQGNGVAALVNQELYNTMGELQLIKTEEKDRIVAQHGEISNTSAVALRDLDRDVKRLKNEVLLSFATLINSIGLITADNVSEQLRELKRLENKVEDFYYDQQTRNKMFRKTILCLENVKVLIDQLNAESADLTELERIFQFSSPQFLKLIDIIVKEKEESLLNENTSSEDASQVNQFDKISSIIFVEQKSVAVRMCSIFKKLAHLDARFCGLRVDYVHSPAGGFFNKKTGRYMYTEESMAERRRIQEILTKFKAKELNVLISTSVVEEGLDVRSCNLVIKYDFPLTFRSYVQSKGRARKKPSKYIMFVDTATPGLKLLDDYKEIEEFSLRECHYSGPVEIDLEEAVDEDIFYTDPENPDTSPYITGCKAISLIYKYVNKIPVDRFTRLVPIWKLIEEKDSSAQNSLLRGLGLCDDAGYHCDLYMPHKTPFRNKITGPVRDSKEEAKRACALLAVRRLYELGELDHRLKVRKPEPLEDTETDSEGEEENDEERRGRKIGTTRRRNFYEYIEPWPLNIPPSTNEAYLYKISMSLTKSLEMSRYKHYFPEKDPNSLGMIMGVQGPNFGPLTLFGPSGELSITVSFLQKLTLKEDVLKKAKDFHAFAFNKVLQIDHLSFEQISSMILVPLTNDEINFQVMTDEIGLENAVVQPKYIREPELYFVEEIIADITPQSKVRDTNLTHMDIFKQKYNIRIQDPGQPMLRISRADKKKFMFTPGDERLQDNTSNDLNKRTLLIPELMEIQPLPAGLWRQIQVVPFVIERMRSSLYSNYLTQQLTQINIEANKPVKLYGSATESLKFDKLLEYDPRGSSLKNLDLLECLTLKNCSDIFDLERLEVLGDVYLKYSVGYFMFYAYSSYQRQEEETRNFTEGDMTASRSKIIGNKNLLRIGLDNLKLGTGAVNAVKINTHTTFLPPGATANKDKWLIEMDKKFPELIEDKKKRNTLSVGAMLKRLNDKDLDKPTNEVLELAKDRFLNNAEGVQGVWTRSYRNISDKSLSDSIEAIIGAFLLFCGQKNCLKVMAKMGINCFCPGSSPDDFKTAIDNLRERKMEMIEHPQEFTPPRDAFVNSRITDDSLDKLYRTVGIREIEEKIGYKFKEKSFLLQAFTHSSDSENTATESYEQLEYLGDGVLDYIVTCYIFTKGEGKLDPGELTEIRSALVCNNMFAGLLVDKGLHGNILYSAPAIRAKIAEYVSYRKMSSELQERESRRVNGQARCTIKSKDGLMLLNETEPPTMEEVEVPKVLGDVFEALIGAVYLDSGHDLHTVWKVYQGFNPEIDAIMADPPRNPKKLLHEHFQNIEFGKAEVRDHNVRIQVTLSYKGKTYRFAGLGNNRRQAEIAASKCALKNLNKRMYQKIIQ